MVSAIAPLTSTMALVVLPDIQRQLHVNTAAVGLLIAAYLVALALVQPLGGRLGDAWGRGRVLMVGLAIIVAASLLATLAVNYPVLLAARMVQAAGGGLAFPNAMAALRDRFPAERMGRALGIVGAVMVASGGVGVPLAEALRSLTTWRGVFLVGALQAGIAALVIYQYGLPRAVARPAHAPITGRVLARSHVIAVGALTLTNVSMYAFLVAASLALSRHAASKSGVTAAVLFVFFAGSMIGAPIGGRASDRLGRWRLSSVGLGALALGVPLALTGPAGLAVAVLGALLAGAGAGTATGALQAAALEGIPALRTGRVAGLISSGRYVGAAIGSGLAALAGTHVLLGVCASLALVSVTAAIAAGLSITADRAERNRSRRRMRLDAQDFDLSGAHAGL